MFLFRTLTVLFFVFIQIAAGFSQQWPVEIIRENIVGGWILPGDFDNDADADLLIQSGDTLFWYENLQPGWTMHLIDTQFLNSSLAGIEILDMDRDGDLDVLQFPLVNPSTISWNENKMNGTLWEKHIIANTANQPGNIVDNYGDLDGDNDIDFAIASTDNGTILWFENVSGDTTWQEHQVAGIGSEAIWTTVVDIDGDDDLDIVGARYSNGNIFWYENQLPDTVWTPHSIAVLSGTIIGFSADIDNDGDPDIITHSITRNMVNWYENPSWTGHAIAASIRAPIAGPIGDIDQDGDLDVMVGSRDYIYWYENLGTAIRWKPHFIDQVSNRYPTVVRLADLNSDTYPDFTAYTIDISNNLLDARWYANPITSTSIDENHAVELPSEFALLENSPNPFNPSTTISYQLPVASNVTLTVLDRLGRQVATLANGQQPAGTHQLQFDANGLASGVYFYRLSATSSAGQSFVQTRKLMLLK